MLLSPLARIGSFLGTPFLRHSIGFRRMSCYDWPPQICPSFLWRCSVGVLEFWFGSVFWCGLCTDFPGDLRGVYDTRLDDCSVDVEVCFLINSKVTSKKY